MLHELGDSVGGKPHGSRGSLGFLFFEGMPDALMESVELGQILIPVFFFASDVQDIRAEGAPEVVERLLRHLTAHKGPDLLGEDNLLLTDVYSGLVERNNLGIPVTVVSDTVQAVACLLERQAKLVRAEHTEAAAHAAKRRAAIEGVDDGEVTNNLILTRQQHLGERGLGDHGATIPVGVNLVRASDLFDEATDIRRLHHLVVSANDTEALIGIRAVGHDLVTSDGRSATELSAGASLDLTSLIDIKHYYYP